MIVPPRNVEVGNAVRIQRQKEEREIKRKREKRFEAGVGK